MQGGVMKKRHHHKDRILLVNITRLGDMLQATPTIAGMKMENPDCHITVLVEKQFDKVCYSIPNIDEVISLDLGMTVRSLSREKDGIVDAYEYISEVVEDLKKKSFDYCLNMSSSAYTAILLKLLGIPNKGGWASDEEGYRVIESDWAQLFATSVFHQNRQYNSLNLVDVFRCSADVELHPNTLLMNVTDEDTEYCHKFLNEAGFSNDGPLIVLQAGASQGKRQWAPERFIRLIGILTDQINARVVLSGTAKELPVIEVIKNGAHSENVVIAAGKTNIGQVAALLKLSSVLITGDTGPMHIAVAVGTPVVSMFLASAFGYETGPYSADNIVLQPVISCGPCNPNKACSRPDCHECIDPELVAELTIQRVRGEITSVPDSIADPSRVIVYRSVFDKWGFCDFKALNSSNFDRLKRYRSAYRSVWLDDLGGFPPDNVYQENGQASLALNSALQGLSDLVNSGEEGLITIDELIGLIQDTSAPARLLGENSEHLAEIDRNIEKLGYNYPYLGPLSRMFIFAKENLSGTDAIALASQMREIYGSLVRRGKKLNHYYNTTA